MELDKAPIFPHVLIFPFPVQGHVNSMLKLAELLSLAAGGGIRITFLNSDCTHNRLLQFSDAESRFSVYPGFQFKTIDDHRIPMEKLTKGDKVLDLVGAMESEMKPDFRDMLSRMDPPVTCVIGDGLLGFIREVSMELGIPVIRFRTISPCCFWVNYCLPDLIEAGELPIQDMDRKISKVPGMESFLRSRDLPGMCRVSGLDDPTLVMLINATRESPPLSPLILNTFEDLDSSVLSQIRRHFPQTYAIGPLHQHLESRLRTMSFGSQNNINTQSSSSNSLWKEEASCLKWLDQQPEGSVLYVNFGSITVMTADRIVEFWEGLSSSKHRFLWVMRPGLIPDKELEKIPQEILNQKEGFYKVVVGWAPQEEVLNHAAVGGFLTHSGWNSTLESVAAGVPMICWPFFADQLVNSRVVSEVYNLGLDMKDVCDRKVVERMVNDLMDERKDEFQSLAAKMAALAKGSVSEGGSSCRNLEVLIQDIRLMSVKGT
uniref:Glycosyltransferase n=1 Tax=Linum usitatissimum TaxID=4006 RepID=I2BHB2_LINUS|nr:UDP-glycosyltransferase 1 [Linum usitatissimum]